MLVMKSSPPGFSLLILILSTSSMFGLGSVVMNSYSQVYTHHTWEEAGKNCRSINADLAVVQTENDMGMINYVDFYSWVAHSKDRSGTWIWSSSVKNTYYAWAGDEPSATDACAALRQSTQQLYGFPCEDNFFFYCEINSIMMFMNTSKTWAEAQEYCIVNEKYLFSVSTSYKYDFDFASWVDAGSNIPSENCVTITTPTNKVITPEDCNDHFPSVCMTSNVILIKEKMSWEEAMKHCRVKGYELMSDETGDDDALLRAKASLADTEQVWVGLRFLGESWFWTNGVSAASRKLPQCPLPGKNCGVISKTPAMMEMTAMMQTTAMVDTADCGEKKNFLCYKP